MAPLVFLLIIATGVLVTRQLWCKKQGLTIARPSNLNLEGLAETTQPQSRFIGTLVIGSDRCVLECNDTFCDFFRLNHKDVVGRRITTLFRRSLAPHLRRPELLEGRLSHDATAASKLSPLEFGLNIPGRTEALKVVHTTAVLEDARLGEARVEYFVNVNELVGHKPSVRLEHPPQPTAIDPLADEPALSDEPPAVHIDPSLCPVSLNGPALSLLSNGDDARHLLGKPLTSSSGWLGDTSILAEIRKTLRGGGSSKTRRQLSANGPWVNVSIIPAPEGVLLTLKADSDTRLTPREQVQPQKQGDLFASLAPSRPTSSPERPSRPPGRRSSLANPPEQTEFLFRPSPGLH